MNKIKVWNYLSEYEDEKSEILSAIERVLESGWLILGSEVKSFENEFTSFIGSKYGIGVNSATDALFIALKALDVGLGDEVITVSNTAVPTVSAIGATGARTRFVDINPETYLMDVNQLENAITNKTKIILPVHLYGQCVDMKFVKKIADKYNLGIIEDCAQAHGATYNGNFAGNMSDISAFSFYPTKILGGYGDGGMICTKSKNLADKCRRLRFYGMESNYYSLEEGYNSRLDEVHAAILRGKLKRLNTYLSRRREIASIYDRELCQIDSLKLPKYINCGEHAFYLYVVAHAERDKIIAELKKNDINVNISYPWPIHTMDGYQHLGYKKGDLPFTEDAQNKIFSLPMYPSLNNKQVLKVCKELKSIIENL